MNGAQAELVKGLCSIAVSGCIALAIVGGGTLATYLIAKLARLDFMDDFWWLFAIWLIAQGAIVLAIVVVQFRMLA